MTTLLNRLLDYNSRKVLDTIHEQLIRERNDAIRERDKAIRERDEAIALCERLIAINRG